MENFTMSKSLPAVEGEGLFEKLELKHFTS